MNVIYCVIIKEIDLSFYIMCDTVENIYSLKIFSLLQYSNKYLLQFGEGLCFICQIHRNNLDLSKRNKVLISYTS